MPIITPSSHGGGSGIGPVAVTGTPAAGDLVVATSPTTAEWQPQGLLRTDIGLPVVGVIHEELVADFFLNLASTMTSPPQVFAAANGLEYLISLTNVPDIGDTLDITYTLFITNQTGTSSGLVTGSTSTPTPAWSFQVDFTGTTATIVGVDLTWDDAAGSFTSTAGGVYTAMVFVTTGPD